MQLSVNPNNYNGNSDPLEKALFILQDAIVILNRKSVITYINKAGQQIFEGQLNYKPSFGDEFVSLLTDDKKESAREFIDRAFCNETSVFEIHYPQSGESTWFELGFYPMPDENGIVTHVCVRAKNITDKILLEKMLDKQRRKQKNLLIKATFDAQEKQRTEIGRELHDNINQVLTTVKLYNEICLTEEFTNKILLMKSVQQINFCIESIRSLSKELSSPSIEEINLKESIRELTLSITETRKIEANFYSYNIIDDKISQDLQTCIYRITQEQLTNVLKYANASLVEVILVMTSESIAIRIQDNGAGFDFLQTRKGVGITNMISRAETLDGTIEIKTSPGQGCTLMAEFPLD